MVTVNQAAKPGTYPVPWVDDIFASQSGGKTFSKLDLANAYQQIPLESQSKQLVTINTHNGWYCYNRFCSSINFPAYYEKYLTGHSKYQHLFR